MDKLDIHGIGPHLRRESAERTILEIELIEFLKTAGDPSPHNTATFIILYRHRILDLLNRMENVK